MPIWQRLSHPHILPFRGVNMTLFQLALVYDLSENGDIIQYTASHPGASPIVLVSIATATAESRAVADPGYAR